MQLSAGRSSAQVQVKHVSSSSTSPCDFISLFTGGVIYPRLSDLSASGSKLAHVYHDIFM